MAFSRSLSGRLLVITIVIVMVIELVIFAPSVARFREDYLQERLRMAELATLAILATPEGMLEPDLEAELLARAQAKAIAIRSGGARALVLNAMPDGAVEATFDLREAGPLDLLIDAVRLLTLGGDRLIRVIGEPDENGDSVEITLQERPLVLAVRAYAVRILWLSLIISTGTALALYLLMRRLLVRPMARLAESMAAFRDNPENGAGAIQPTSRVAEVAQVETALADLQTALREALRQKGRLAALGEAVAKISHDLRNMLSTAQLLADRIQTSDDPVSARVGPKLVASVDRAVALCESTLRFGAAREAEPEPRRVALAALIDEVGESVFPDPDRPGPVRFENDAPRDLVVMADPDQLFRIMVNLVRNARQALESASRAGRVGVTARAAAGQIEIDIADDGPGLPARALDNLFQPFRGGARRGGTGLGLAIAQELAELQGGRLTLVASTTEGATFRLILPLRAAPLPKAAPTPPSPSAAATPPERTAANRSAP
jgi:signal transduction histidine kinase